MDERTRRLLRDFHALRDGGAHNGLDQLARRWLEELRAEEAEARADFETFFAGLDTLVVQCRDRKG